MHPQIARLIQGLLACTCVLLLIIWLSLRKQQKLLSSDPSSIATIASLLSHPDTIRDFETLDQVASKADIRKQLSDKRYQLNVYQARDGSERLGLVPLTARDPVSESSSTARQDHPPKTITSTQRSNHKTPNLKQTILNTLLFALCAILLTILAIYYTNHDMSQPLEKFMDSQSFGPRFLLTAIGMLIKSQWARLERRAVVYEPFNRLTNSREGTRDNNFDVVLASRPLIPMLTLFSCTRRRSFKPALLAFTAILSEIMIIFLPGIPFASVQVWIATRIAFYVCFSILGFMLVVLFSLGVVRCWRKEGVKLHHDPNTLGAMIMYLAGSRLAEEMIVSSTKEGGDVGGVWCRRVGLKRRKGTGESEYVVDYDDEAEGSV